MQHILKNRLERSNKPFDVVFSIMFGSSALDPDRVQDLEMKISVLSTVFLKSFLDPERVHIFSYVDYETDGFSTKKLCEKYSKSLIWECGSRVVVTNNFMDTRTLNNENVRVWGGLKSFFHG